MITFFALVATEQKQQRSQIRVVCDEKYIFAGKEINIIS